MEWISLHARVKFHSFRVRDVLSYGVDFTIDARVNFHSSGVKDMLSNGVDLTTSSCKSEISLFKNEKYVVLWSGFL